MKSILAGFMAMLLLMSFAGIAAQEAENGADAGAVNTETVTVPAEDVIPATETGGATPDQPLLWGLDRAIERIELALTFDKAAKAEKGLEHARERLLEVREMIKAKKLAQAEKAKEKQVEALKGVKAKIKEIKADDPEKELEQKLALEEKLAEHEEDIEKVEIETETVGLTEQQAETVNTMIDSAKESVSEATDEVEAQEAGIKTKLKAKLELSDEEVDKIIEQAKDKWKAAREARAEKAIARFDRAITRAENKIEKFKEKNVSEEKIAKLEEKLSVAQDLLEQAKQLEQSGDYRNVRATINEAIRLRKETILGKPFDETGKARAIAVITEAIERRQANLALKAEISEGNVSAVEQAQQKVDNAITKLSAVRDKLAAKIAAVNAGTKPEAEDESNAGAETGEEPNTSA